jgi:hypothetical protein
MGKVPAIEESQETINVHNWRRDWLRKGGFNKRNAELLASSSVDWRYANRLLHNAKDKGYDEEFVMRLLF